MLSVAQVPRAVAQVPRAVATVAEESPQSRLNRSTKVAKLELLASNRSTKAALKLEAMTA